jgi:cob(I)alamin adenosyltransferase
MKIYTRTGDSGTTGLFGGGRVGKDEARVEAYGSVDELNACIGVVRATCGRGELEQTLEAIQGDLLTLGAELGCAPGKEPRLGMVLIGAADVARLEDLIDLSEAKLDPLKTFVLPGGSPAAASLHVARTVCRRAERRVIASRRSAPIRDEVIHYLNRLSDLLFVLAREANRNAGVGDTPWSGRA